MSLGLEGCAGRIEAIVYAEVMSSVSWQAHTEDLPAETPPEREITMLIPIKPGSKPPHQAPYRVPPGVDATI